MFICNHDETLIKSIYLNVLHVVTHVHYLQLTDLLSQAASNKKTKCCMSNRLDNYEHDAI